MIIWDQHGSHSGTLSDDLDQLNVMSEPVPRGDHNKLGKVERRIQSLKKMMEKIQASRDLDGEGGAFAALSAANEQLNRQVMDNGYSPEQRLLLRSHHFPEVAIDWSTLLEPSHPHRRVSSDCYLTTLSGFMVWLTRWRCPAGIVCAPARQSAAASTVSRMSRR